MRHYFLAALPALLLIGPSLLAGPKRVPAQLARARYVALGYDAGDRFVGENEVVGAADDVLPEEYAALGAVRDMIEQSDRYVITTRPEQAEILIAVRTGRRGTVSARTGLGSRRASSGHAFGGEISSPESMLSVYECSGGRPGTLLWREKQDAGRPGFPHRLFEQLVADVASTPKKP